MKRLRIVIVTEVFLPKIDGITNRLAHTIRALHRAGHEVLVIAPDVSVSAFDGARVVGIGSLPFPPYPGVRMCWPSPHIYTSIRDFRPDVVHLVGPTCLGGFAVAAARLLGVPSVASFHTHMARYMVAYGYGWLIWLYWPLMRAFHNSAVLNLCPTRETRAELIARRFRDVGFWQGGVDTRLFHPRHATWAMRERLSGGVPEAPLAVYVGRVGFEKGLEAFEPLLDAIGGLRIAIVGDGPARAALERRYRGRPVVFTGFLDGPELAASYASADLFLQPSTTETLGFVTLEALASGLPVVGMAAGGTIEIVQDGVCGRLVPPGDPARFVAAVCELVDDAVERARFAANARRFAERFDWDAETARLVAAYREGITRAHDRHPRPRRRVPPRIAMPSPAEASAGTPPSSRPSLFETLTWDTNSTRHLAMFATTALAVAIWGPWGLLAYPALLLLADVGYYLLSWRVFDPEATVARGYQLSALLQDTLYGQGLDYGFNFYDGDFTKSRDQAQIDKFEHAWAQLRLEPGMCVLDCGCGCGDWLSWLRGRGIEVVGINITPAQVDVCRSRGLDVLLSDWKAVADDEAQMARLEGRFDAVTFWDTVEHYVPMRLRMDRPAQNAIYQKMFAFANRLLRPDSPSGRVFISCLHMRYGVSRMPFGLRKMRLLFMAYILDKFHSGCYPSAPLDQLVANAPDFSLVERKDTTLDYYMTSKLEATHFGRHHFAWTPERFAALAWLPIADPFWAQRYLWFGIEGWMDQFDEDDLDNSPVIHWWLTLEHAASRTA
ncbi:MAG: glycosyltransferase [Myxococcota bacterium]